MFRTWIFTISIRDLPSKPLQIPNRRFPCLATAGCGQQPNERHRLRAESGRSGLLAPRRRKESEGSSYSGFLIFPVRMLIT